MAFPDDLRFAWRAIRRRWRLASAVVATLGVAVAANGAVFSVLNALWLRPLPFPNADRIVLVRTRVAGALGNVSLRQYRAITGETRAYPAANQGVTFDVQLLRDAYVGGARRYVWLLAAVLGVVLVGACANVSNLLLARVMERDGELAVRQALGADWVRVVRQLALETALLTGACGLVGALACSRRSSCCSSLSSRSCRRGCASKSTGASSSS